MRPRELALPCTCGESRGEHSTDAPHPCAESGCTAFECADTTAEQLSDLPCDGHEDCLDCYYGETWCFVERARNMMRRSSLSGEQIEAYMDSVYRAVEGR